MCIGRHIVRTWLKRRRVVALHSGEAELYGVATASCEGLGVHAYAADLGPMVRATCTWTLPRRSASSIAQASGA